MVPFTYNRQQKQFETNALHTAYSLIFTIIFVLGFPIIFKDLFAPLYTIFKPNMLSVLTRNNDLLIPTVFSLVVIVQIANRQEIVKFLNESSLQLKSAVQKMPSIEVKFKAWFALAIYLVMFPPINCLCSTINFSRTFGPTTLLKDLQGLTSLSCVSVI
jgi:hypothetical protein